MDDTKEVGRRVLTELMGAEYVEKKAQNRNTFNDVLQDYAEEVCFGRIWGREGLDRKQRSIIRRKGFITRARWKDDDHRKYSGKKHDD